MVVDNTNQIYATRLYETPVNLPEVMTQLHLYAHRKSGAANGWDMINPFPDQERNPLIPTEEEESNKEEDDKTEETEDTEEEKE